MDSAISRQPGAWVPTSFREIVARGDSRVVEGSAFVPNPLPPRHDKDVFVGRLADDLIAAQGAVERLSGVVLALPSPDLLLRPFRLREARLSSVIENTVASAEEIAIVQSKRPTARSEAREVFNYVEALDHGLASPLPLCNRLFKEMHEILMHGVEGGEKRPGKFRDHQVYIGDDRKGFARARYAPPPPGETLETCMADLERFMNPPQHGPEGGRRRYPLIAEVAMGHYQFEAIHPFNDGNGRLGRLIVALSLCKASAMARPLVYVSGYIERHRREYYDRLLAVTMEGDWEGWVRYFCRAIGSQARDGIDRVRKLQSIRDRYTQEATNKRSSVLLSKLIDHLFVAQVVSVSDVCQAIGVTAPTAQKYVDSLKRIGALHEITGGNYGRLYAAREILDIVQEVSDD